MTSKSQGLPLTGSPPDGPNRLTSIATSRNATAKSTTVMTQIVKGRCCTPAVRGSRSMIATAYYVSQQTIREEQLKWAIIGLTGHVRSWRDPAASFVPGE